MARATVMVLAAALFVLLLASAASVAGAGRADPAEGAAAGTVSPHQKEGAETVAVEGGCEGANDEDECSARRTLAAHTDYIYTQEHHN
ncbi:phytosulfokines 4-like [Phragmites australis]|uniref:phytosulfokines 4-like n=1 Tax=Phragmites australis TaxID=29695 RepID=UPI002D77F19C|nr:phytosulfokines 4-like [Phragmites australis]